MATRARERPSLSSRAGRGRSRLVVVSNRLPFTFRKTSEGWRAEPGSGGLVTAMLPLLRKRGGTWVGLLTDYAIRLGFDVRPFRLAFSGQSIGIYALPKHLKA